MALLIYRSLATSFRGKHHSLLATSLRQLNLRSIVLLQWTQTVKQAIVMLPSDTMQCTTAFRRPRRPGGAMAMGV
jgi:hypothetical protein